MSTLEHGRSRQSLGAHLDGIAKEFLATSVGAAMAWGASYVLRYNTWNSGLCELADMARVTQSEYDSLPLTTHQNEY